ncbi:MAG: MarR family winged helix-turn-helix transcriptional regulator [Pseudomonadota bacterium]
MTSRTPSTHDTSSPDKGDNALLVDHIGADLWRAFRAYEAVMYAQVDALGFPDISVADSEILVLIGGRGARLVDIARARRVSKQAAHEQIQSLVRRGYLQTEPDPTDRRAKRVSYTQKGLAFAMALAGVKRDVHQRVLKTLGPTQLAELRALLGKIDL